MSPFRPALGGLACLFCAAPIHAAETAWELAGESGLAIQHYVAGGVDESALARQLGLELSGRPAPSWHTRAALRHEASLYTEEGAGTLTLGYLGRRGECGLSLGAARSSEGGLATPLLLFDPDLVESQAAASQAAWSRRGSLDLGWRTGLGRAGISAGYLDLDYDESSAILADRRELELRLELDAEASERLQLELELAGLGVDYRERDTSDRSELEAALRLGRDLAVGEVALTVDVEAHAPRVPDGVAYYERPEGKTWSLGGELLLWAPSADLSLLLSAGRERWAGAADNYFHSGDHQALEVMGGLARQLGARALRMELHLDLERFDPDLLPSGDALRRPAEARGAAGVRLRWGPDGRFPLEADLGAEFLRQETDQVDRFRIIEERLELGWRPAPAWLASFALRAEHYLSRYGDDLAADEAAPDGEWALGGELRAAWVRVPWRLEFHLARQEQHSFLLGSQASRNEELGLRILWHP